MNRVFTVAVLVSCFCGVRAAPAATVYSIGFAPSVFTAGSLNGEDGRGAAGSVLIESGMPTNESPTTAPARSTGKCINLAISYDFRAEVPSVFLNGSPITGVLPFMQASNTQFIAGFYADNFANQGVLFTDNHAVVTSSAVPERSSLFLSSAGCEPIAGPLRKRRL